MTCATSVDLEQHTHPHKLTTVDTGSGHNVCTLKNLLSNITITHADLGLH